MTVSVRLVFGSTTTVTGLIGWVLPVVGTVGTEVGSTWAFDSSAAAFLSGSLHVTAYFILGSGRATATTPWTWAVGDWLSFSISYYG